MSAFQVDDLAFELRLRGRRKTVQITVERDGDLVLAAPKGTDEVLLRQFVREKRTWIYTKLAEKAQRQRAIPQKVFVDGEGFLYLGRSYRLKLVDEPAAGLKLVGGRFLLGRDLANQGRAQFIRWYLTHGYRWLAPKVAEHASRMEVRPAGVKVQDLGYRWGSCGKGDWLYFHWKAILLPRTVAEYVVVHELAHLHEPHHTKAFWRRVERALPDFERRKQWLEAHGMEVEGL